MPKVALCFLLLVIGLSLRAQLPFTQPVEITAQDTPVRTFLQQFLQEQSILALVDESVTGNISGKFIDKDARVVFERVINAYNLVWTYDGNMLYVDTPGTITTTFVETVYVSSEELISTLKTIGIESSHGVTKPVSDKPLVMVSGPERYTKMVTSYITNYNLAASTRMTTEIVIDVFPLKHAWAFDLSFTYRDSSLSIPGVATILNNLVGTDSDTQNMPGTIGEEPVPLNSLTNTGASAWATSSDVSQAASQVSSGSQKSGSQAPAQFGQGENEITEITSDNRTNSVIIRDTLDRMDSYRSVIEKLDKPVKVIAISVAVIDLSVSNSLNLGIQTFSADMSNGNSLDISTLGDLDTVSTTANIAGTILSNGSTFMADVEALQTRGEANILSRPSVMTFDNMEATISQTQDFYVEVSGTFASELYEVSTGLTLEFVPHLIADETSEGTNTKDGLQARRLISLLVDVTDGEFDDTYSSSNDIPLVSEVTLSTQAVLYENQSLLIGGIYKHDQSDSESGIPLLMDIPLLGPLFKYDERSLEKTERLFLITPTIIELNSTDSRPYVGYFQVSPLSSTVPAEKLVDKLPDSQVLNATGQNPQLPSVFDALTSFGPMEDRATRGVTVPYARTPTGYYLLDPNAKKPEPEENPSRANHHRTINQRRARK